MFSLIRLWESSGLTQEQFFKQHEITRSTFSYWRKKYLKEKRSVPKEGNFIPVQIANNDFSDKDAEVLELVYPNGIRLVFPVSLDLFRLKPLIVL